MREGLGDTSEGERWPRLRQAAQGGCGRVSGQLGGARVRGGERLKKEGGRIKNFKQGLYVGSNDDMWAPSILLMVLNSGASYLTQLLQPNRILGWTHLS